MEEKINKIIEDKKKSITLLEELKQALEYEKCDGSIRLVDPSRNFYIFFDKEGNNKFEGSLERCIKKAEQRSLKYIIIK